MQQGQPVSGPHGIHHSAPATLLVADDDPQLRDLYQIIMEGVGHRVSLARDGRECLEFYRRSLEQQTPYDLVLLDLYMPEMGGRECLEGIFAMNPEAKVLMSTGSPAEELGPWAEKTAGIIHKPVSIVNLLDHISRCLGRTMMV